MMHPNKQNRFLVLIKLHLLIITRNSPEELKITFDETSNKVSGFSGCNNFSGDYSVSENKITFGPLVSTKRACKRFMDVEQHMLKALSQAESFSFENGVLNLNNSKTVLLKAIKNTETRIAQDDDYTIEYKAETRGSYKMVSLKNNSVSYSTQRGADPISRACSEEEIKLVVEKLNGIELEKLKTLEAPTEDRFTDKAAIGRFKIIHKGITYETPQFDDGNPNAYISDLVKTLTSMMEKH